MCQEPAVLGAKNAVLSKLTNFKPDLQDGVWLLGWGLVGQILRLNNLPMSSPYIFLQPFLEHVWNSLCVPLFVPLLFWIEKKKNPRNSLSIYWECKVFAKTTFCLLLPLFILWGRFCYLLWVTEEETDAQRGETGCSRLQSLRELLDEAPLYKLSHVGYPSLFQIEKLFKIPKSNPTVV